jgi:PAS domain S-box-containing protein
MSPEDRALSDPENNSVSSPSLEVLYVDDESVFRDICRIYLGRYGITVTTAASVREALHLLESGRFDVILSDYQMPGIDGSGFLKILREKKITLPVVIFSGMNNDKTLIGSVSNGAMYYVRKGGTPRTMFEELACKIRDASRKDQQKESNHEARVRYRTLFEHAGTAIVTFDDSMVIATANSSFMKLTGYGKSEVEGILRWTDIVHDCDAGQLMDFIFLLRQEPTSSGKELSFLLKTKNNRSRPVLATVSPVPDTRWSIASMIEIWQPPVYWGTSSTKT